MRWIFLPILWLLPSAADAPSAWPVWISGFAAPPTEMVPADVLAGGRTIRQIMRVTAGGERLRIRLSNVENSRALRIGAMTVAGAPVTFNGRTATVIAPGAPLFSDAVAHPVKAGARIEVRLFLPDIDARPTIHWYGMDTASISPPGNFVTGTTFPVARTSTFRFVISGVDVERAEPITVVAAVGDSITDGSGTTVDADARWPDILARRLAASSAEAAVVNTGIGGNRLLRDGSFTGAGRALLARLDDDVMSLDGLRIMVVLIGINDLGWPAQTRGSGANVPIGELPTADAMIDGYCQIVRRGHARGVKVIGGTLLPFAGARDGYFTPAKEAIRSAVNARLRAGACFDGLIDFDAALRDPSQPDRLLPRYDSGDHLHPSDAGYAAMAATVDLKLVGYGATAIASTSIR